MEEASNAESEALEEFLARLGTKPKGELCTNTEIDKATAYLEQGETAPIRSAARVFVRAHQYEEAERLLLLACDAEEKRAAQGLRGVDRNAYISLAGVYRKLKRYRDEVKTLERFAAQRQAPHAMPKMFVTLLEKAKADARKCDGTGGHSG